jgi:hypothetical protein
LAVILVIDASNVLHASGGLPPDLAGWDLEDLLAWLGRSRHARDRVILACDGGRPASTRRQSPDLAGGEQPGRIEMRFSGPRRTADDLIAQIVRESDAPRDLLVVSSDREVRRSGRRRRCHTMTSERFVARLVADAERTAARNGRQPRRPRAPLSRKQVEEWQGIFGLRGGNVPEVGLPPDLVKRIAPHKPEAAAPGAEPARTPGKARPRRGRAARSGDRTHPAGDPFPPDVLEQAQRLWSGSQHTRPDASRRTPP